MGMLPLRVIGYLSATPGYQLFVPLSIIYRRPRLIGLIFLSHTVASGSSAIEDRDMNRLTLSLLQIKLTKETHCDMSNRTI